LKKFWVILAILIVSSTLIPTASAGTSPIAEAGSNQSVEEGASIILNAAGSKGSAVGKTGPFKILWYDDYEENSYSGSIREYLVSKGHIVTYFADGASGFLNLNNYMTYDVVVAEHTCGPNTIAYLSQWFEAGKGYVVLENYAMYTDSTDAYIKTLLGVDNNGLNPSYPGTWTESQLYFKDPSHPIANYPNTFNIKGITCSLQSRNRVVITGGTNVVEYAPGLAALQVRENVEGSGKVAYFGANFHNAERADPETRMLVENMIYWAAGASSSSPIVQYEWDLTSDGVYDYSETSVSAPDGAFDGRTTAAYGDNGVNTVTLRITDATGAKAADTCVITVTNAWPTLNMGTGPTVDEGTEITYIGTFTDPGWLDTHTATWNWGDGTPAEAATITEENLQPLSSGSATGIHVYTNEGNYAQVLTLRDKDGAERIWARTVTVMNLPPVVEAGEDVTSIEGKPVAFDGSGTSDPGVNDVLAYSWNFGDTTTASTEVNPTHIYPDNGVYTVTLTVKDDTGAQSVDTLTVTVENAPPVVSATNDGPVDEGVAVTMTATQTDPGTFDTFTYSFDWNNDGTYEITDQSEASATYTWLDNGEYTVAIKVKDKDGGVGEITTLVVVGDLKPVAEFTWPPEPQNEGSPVTFTEVSTSNPDEISGWEWIIDGIVYTEQTLGHIFTDNGLYDVTLTVTDDDGSTNTVTHTVSIENVSPAVEAGPDQMTDEGAEVSFGGAFTDPGADTYSVIWDFGDGETATDALAPSHVYADNGVYTVTLTVTDKDGGVGVDTLVVTVNNVVPTAEAGADHAVNEGAQVDFVGGFTDPGDDTHSIAWSFGDGETTEGTLTPSHVYSDDGAYLVTLTVTDKDGGVDEDTLMVTVLDLAPSAGFTWGPEPQDEGCPVAFTDASTSNPDSITAWAWTIDGQTFSQQNPTYVFTDNRAYTVTLTVTDDDGSTSTVSHTVNVKNVAPTVEADVDQATVEGATVAFTGAFTDPGADTYMFAWSFGDGTTTTGTLSPTHVYLDNRVYTVTLTVTDDDGGVGEDTMTVTVINVAPVAEAGANTACDEGATITFAGSFTDPGTLDTHTYLWAFGDGSTASVQEPNHAYGHEGVYTATLTVTDNDGGVGVDSLTVIVANVAPVIDAGPNQTKTSGEEVIFAGSFTDAGWLDTHTIAWDFGDGSMTTETLTPSHTYLAAGTYIVRLTVTDDGGATTSDTLTVTVSRIRVKIDIKPGDSTPAPINLKNKGKTPVAILGSETLDVKQIKVETAAFGSLGCKTKQYSYEDANGDGFLDLVLHFDTQSAGIGNADTFAYVWAELLDGRQIEGQDAIKIVPK